MQKEFNKNMKKHRRRFVLDSKINHLVPISATMELTSEYTQEFQVILTIVNLMITIVGICGNLFVLYASRVHKALKIDKTSVIFLESLAVSDVILSLVVYLPSAVTIVAGKWILGQEFCYFSKVATISATYNETLVIALMSVYRVWMLRKPPGVRSGVKMGLVYGVAVVLQLVGGGVMGATYLVYPATSTNHTWNGTCDISNIFTLDLPGQFQWLGLLLTTVFVLIPMIVTILTTGRIFFVFCGYDKKMGRKNKNRYRFVKLLLFVCVTFVASYVPLMVSSIYSFFNEAALPRFLELSVNYFLAINVISNPFIYVIISPHFSGYLKECGKKIRALCCIQTSPPREDASEDNDSERHSTFRKSDEVITIYQTSAAC